MFLKRIFPILIVLCFPINALGQASGISQEPWYKVAAGIIAIPAAVLGLVYSYRLLRRTNLETRKLELEILEKESKFQAAADAEGLQALRELIEPIGLTQRLSVLILRFIILELTLRLWNFIPFTVGKVLTLATFSLWFAAGGPPNLQSVGGATVFAVPQVIDIAFDIVYWFIVFGFGWPLLKDAASLMGISLKSIFDLPFFWKRKKRVTD